MLFLPIPIDPSTPDFFELYLNNNNNNNNGGNTGTTDANNFGSLGNNRKHKNVINTSSHFKNTGSILRLRSAPPLF